MFILLVIIGGSTASATLNDGDVVLGAAPVNACTAGTNVNCTNSLTAVVNTSNGGDAFHGFSASGIGLGGFSNIGTGVKGEGGESGVVGKATANSGEGVAGYGTGSDSFGVYGEGSLAGIHGTGTVAGADGVFGTTFNGGPNSAGVHGFTYTGTGVKGQGPTGVVGTSTDSDFGVGVLGTGGRTGVSGAGDNAGVRGSAQAAGGYGVLGGSFDDPNSAGVRGDASFHGIGVEATNGPNPANTAFMARGKTSFSRSGTVTVAAGSSSATQSPIDLTAASLVLTTIQGNQPGVYVQGVTKVTGSSGSFTVHLNKNATANLRVAWFVLN